MDFAVRDMAPFAVALVPFSLAIGTAAASNGLSLLQTVLGAATLWAGTAQLAAIELIGGDASAALIVGTIVLINARFALYGAGLNQWFSAAPRWQRMLLVIPLVDQTFLSCEERFTTLTGLADRRRYYLTASAMLMTVFVGSQILGYQVGARVPDWLGLHLAAPLAFAGMLVKSAHGKINSTAAIAAAITFVLAAGLPGGLGLPIALVAGMTAGNLAKRMNQ
jgi:predicted branched-subunit amino acid permease